MKNTPIGIDHFLLVILTIPLIDKSSQINLYNVHNLPILYSELVMQFSHILEGQYLAFSRHGFYAVIPVEYDIVPIFPIYF